jgi:hypothetical protein
MFRMLTLCAATLSNIHVLSLLRCVHLRYVATPTKELDRSNFRRQLDSLKQDHEQELAELKAHLNDSFAQLEKTGVQLSEARSQLNGFGATKEADREDVAILVDRKQDVQVQYFFSSCFCVFIFCSSLS